MFLFLISCLFADSTSTSHSFCFSFPFSLLLSLSFFYHSPICLLSFSIFFTPTMILTPYIYSFLSAFHLHIYCMSPPLLFSPLFPHFFKVPKCEIFDLLDSHDFIQKAPMGRRLQDCNKKFKRLSFYGFEVCSAKILRCTLKNLGEIGQK